MVFPRPNRPQFEKATSLDLPLPKEVQKGGEASRPERGSRLEEGQGSRLEGGQRSRLVVFFSPYGVKQRGNIREKLKGNNERAKSFQNFHAFSEFFTLFHNFSPRTFPFKTKGSSRRTKEKKR